MTPALRVVPLTLALIGSAAAVGASQSGGWGGAGGAGVATVTDLIALARAGTARYRDPGVAASAGYRRVGPDFPGMGQHWVHPRLILRSVPDPAAPPILEYAEIEGRVTLVGVAYAVLVGGPHAPRELPVPAEAWHLHGGTVEEESFLRSHAGVGHDLAGPQVAVLHAWIWLENRDGVFATDNWALPFARFGYADPGAAPRGAARALALAAGDGGRAYVEALLRAVGRPDTAEAAKLSAVVARHHEGARALVARHDGASNRALVSGLAGCWDALWAEVQVVVRADVWERLATLR